jgi:hypothetical protein
MDSHEKYLELCAASTAGELSHGEEQELQEHLADCTSCWRIKREYELLVENAVPALADHPASPAFEPDSDWSLGVVRDFLLRYRLHGRAPTTQRLTLKFSKPIETSQKELEAAHPSDR